MFIISFHTVNVILLVLIIIDILLKIIDFKSNKEKIKQEKITQYKVDEFLRYAKLEEKRFNDSKECEITQRWIDGRVKVTKYFKEENSLKS